MDTIPVVDIPTWAGYFRKPTGTYVYLRMANIEYYKLDAKKVYGVCFNGNMIALDPSTPVVRCDIFDMARNIYGR